MSHSHSCWTFATFLAIEIYNTEYIIIHVATKFTKLNFFFITSRSSHELRPLLFKKYFAWFWRVIKVRMAWSELRISYVVRFKIKTTLTKLTFSAIFLFVPVLIEWYNCIKPNVKVYSKKVYLFFFWYVSSEYIVC